MKIKVLSAVLFALIFSVSCSDSAGKPKNDSLVYDETRPGGENHLEDLLKIKDEVELKSKFGAGHVSYDTIWGAEGNYTMGSYIDKGTKDEVEIYWSDSAGRAGLITAMAKAYYDASGNYIFDNKWSSATGVHIGSTTDELEKLNGKPFVFSGFGWDYGGGIRDWNKGKLEDAGVGVELTESESIGKLPEKEYEQILGDQDVSSDHPVVKKVQPKVYRMSVYHAGS
jgi:hypothetical protein